MKAGTVYSKYEPCVFHGLYVKADEPGNYKDDWLYDDLIGAINADSSEDFTDKCEAMERGESVKMDFEQTGRDGLFDNNQLYAIYETDDIKELINRLSKSL